MKVLVAVFSRHGSTNEMGNAVVETLRRAGIEADAYSPDSPRTIADYDAVIIGSAIYLGHWLKSAKSYVERNSDALRARPVWLFSSGPLGSTSNPNDNPLADLPDLLAATNARGHQQFVGKLDPSSLSLGERIIAKVVRAPEGDFRNWPTIYEWAGDVTSTLLYGAPHPAGSAQPPSRDA